MKKRNTINTQDLEKLAQLKCVPLNVTQPVKPGKTTTNLRQIHRCVQPMKEKGVSKYEIQNIWGWKHQEKKTDAHVTKE